MAAKQKISNLKPKSRIKRRGIHAKTKTAVNKTSKNYVKPYRSQGR